MAEQAVPQQFLASDFKRRRTQNWMIIGLLYAFFYMTRYNFAAMAPDLMAAFGWTKTDVGHFEFLLPLVYGIAVFLNGPIAEKLGGRKAFLLGSAGVVVMNLLFGLSFSLITVDPVTHLEGNKLIVDQTAQLAGGLSMPTLVWTLAIIWAINGYFQSFGALSIVKINSQWFHTRERGTFSAIFGVLIRFGIILAFSVTPLVGAILGTRWAFFVPAICVAILFVATLLGVKDNPAQAGFKDMDTGDGCGAAEAEEKFDMKEVLKKVFANKTMWIIALGAMMLGIARRSIVDSWWPLYFSENFGVTKTDILYHITSWGVAIVGIIGGFAFGMFSDRKIQGRRAPMVVIGFAGIIILLALFWLIEDVCGIRTPWFGCIMICLMGFFVNGAHGMVGGASAMDFGGRKAAATAAGLIDGAQYLASAIVGPAVPYITQNMGWNIWKLWPIPFAIIGLAVMATLWNATPKGGLKKAPAQDKN